MQEQVNEKSVSLVFRGTKFTAHLLQNAMAKALADMSHKSQNKRSTQSTYQGKQSIKQLVRQGASISNFEIVDPNIRRFERIAKKYGVDYAVKCDRSCIPPKCLVFFKARDADVLTAAFREFASLNFKKVEKPSLLDMLNHMKSLVKNQVIDQVKNKDKGLER